MLANVFGNVALAKKKKRKEIEARYIQELDWSLITKSPDSVEVKCMREKAKHL